MSLPTTLANIYTRYKKESGDSRISLLQCIKDLNDLLFEMPITKPAEQFSKLYYIDGFYKYVIPTDLKEAIAVYSDKVNVIRYVSYFRYRLEQPLAAFTDRVDNGKRFLMVRNPYTNSNVAVITGCNSLTADGTWALTGSASGATLDENTKEKGGGSIKFTISGTGGVLTFTRTNVIDASSFTEYMRSRFYMWFPTAPTSVEIRVGNDSSNYFTQSVTKQASGENFATEDSNELEFAENDASETGTVDKENIDWFQIRFTFASDPDSSNFRIDHIVLAKPEILDLEYYSKYVGIDSDGALTEKITESESTTDEPIIKDYPDFINCVIDGLCASHLQNKAPKRAATFKSDYLSKRDNKILIGGIAFLKQRYPSRRASYKRIKTLPNLNRRTVGRRRFV